MKAKNVTMLVRKDLRMSKWVLAIAVGIWLLPILLAMMSVVLTGSHYHNRLESVIEGGGSWSFCLTFLVIPAVVGYVLTAEGTDRSAGFLAYMPFSRLESLAGKVISAAMMAGLLLGLNVALVSIPIMMELSRGQRDMSAMVDALHVATVLFLSVSAAVFGTTWGAAVCSRSAAIAMIVGLGVPFSLFVYHIAYYWGEGYAGLERMFIPWSLGLGVAFFIIGVVVFMKRKPEA